MKQIGNIIAFEDSANPYLMWDMRYEPVEHRIQNFHMTVESRSWEHIWCDPAC